MAYKITDFSELWKKAQQTPQTAKTTNLSELANIARSTPQYNRQRQFSTPQYLSRLAQQQYQQMRPMVQSQIRQSEQQFADRARGLQEQMARWGLLRGGRTIGQLQRNNQARINAANAIQTAAMQQAWEQALPVAQFGLSEQSYLDQLRNQQAQRLFENLANYYGMQTAQSQWAQQFAADQAQRMYQNLADYYARKSAENRWAQEMALKEALEGATLTGRYQDQETLAARQLAQQQAEAENQLKLDILKALLDYNINVGEVTEDLPMPKKFTYGDAMVKLLQDLGYL